MKINEILDYEKDESILDIFIKAVHEDCQRFLSNKSYGINLVRGLQTLLGPFIVGAPIYKNRESKWSQYNPGRNIALSNLMKEDGFIATRINGMFSFGIVGNHGETRKEIPDHINNFGESYIIFPIGRYELTWFDSTKMFGKSIDVGSDTWYTNTTGLSYQLSPGPTDEEIAKKFWDKYKHIFSHGINVDQATAGRSEVIIAASSYHAIEASYYFKNDVENKIRAYYENK